MKGYLTGKLFISLSILLAGLMGYVFFFMDDEVDYNADVKPILNRNCITCHGGVKKKGGFSLLFEEEALGPTASGKPAIIPGDADGSEMIRRLTLHDEEERMPYKESPLSEDEIDILTRWIDQGAKWGKHWSYQAVKATEVPKLKRRFLGLLPSPYQSWRKNDIDNFIIEKWADKDLSGSPEADRQVLLRRASLDLIGMPAPAPIANWYLSNPQADAYEQYIDTLLQLPAYGERWTAVWLDLARYADTKGYERDDHRDIWRYRDWLIRSFNQDKPYDVFLTEQIAGDLLPGANDEQYIATAFHRNTMTNDEGGTDNEEYRTAAVVDRVNTTWEVLLGTSFACVQCHSHPYDPFTHKDYYSFMAFFNNTRDEDTEAEYPLLYEYKQADSIRFGHVAQWSKQHLAQPDAERIYTFLKTRQPTINSLKAEPLTDAGLADTKWLALRKNGTAKLTHLDMGNHTRLMVRYVTWPKDGLLNIRLDSLTGPVVSTFPVRDAGKDWVVNEINIKPFSGRHDLYFQYTAPSLKKDQNGILFDWFYLTDELPGKEKTGYDLFKKDYTYLISKSQAVTTPIFYENPENMFRETRIFERGNWLSKADTVHANVPGSLLPFPKDVPKNRLGLARWMTDKQHPLVARTLVNRLWEQLFGQGLVETLEDMGSQGAAPSHPELLDHLAWRLMYIHQWRIKPLLKEIMMSATYRQDARITPENETADRYNKWYARGPRFRLTAEQIRDQALAISGALNQKMYGESIMPWQPDGIWNSPYNGRNWVNSRGKDRFRRAIYVYWKRTAAYPSMMNFDAMQREVCISRRIRTNTPLQALTLLNDPAYLDISRQFAFSLIEIGNQPDNQIRTAFKRALGRDILPKELYTLRVLYDDALQKFQKDPDKTCEMTGMMDEYNLPETAALIVTVHSIMNLDEILTKP